MTVESSRRQVGGQSISKYDKRDRKTDGKAKGYAFYQQSQTPAVCYLCGEQHLYQYPCDQLIAYDERITRLAKRRARRAKAAGKTAFSEPT